MLRRYRGITSEKVLATLDRHPHARTVLAPALAPDGQPSHAWLPMGPIRPGREGGSWPASIRT
jgi:hypothetical protein